MTGQIEIQLDRDNSYPVGAESEAGAIARGWEAWWYVGPLPFGRDVYFGADENAALEAAITLADTGVNVRITEVSAYMRESIAAERACEARS